MNYTMIDIQNTEDKREIPLKKVGVRNVEYPVCVRTKSIKSRIPRPELIFL